MGAIPTTTGVPVPGEGEGDTVTSVGLTQYPVLMQHRGRQRRGTGPPSRAELSPAPLASPPLSDVPSTWCDLGTWETRGGAC